VDESDIELDDERGDDQGATPDAGAADSSERESNGLFAPPIDPLITPPAGPQRAGGPPVRNEACHDGRFDCVTVRLNVIVDLFALAKMSRLSASVDGAEFEATGSGGIVVMEVPSKVEFLLSVNEADPEYWQTDYVVKLPFSEHETEGAVGVFSDQTLREFFEDVGQSLDESKGIVMLGFLERLPGAGAVLNHQSDPGVVQGPRLMRSESPTLLEDSIGGAVTFGNVEPGTFTPTLIDPEGYHCYMSPNPEHGFVARPRTVTTIGAICDPE